MIYIYICSFTSLSPATSPLDPPWRLVEDGLGLGRPKASAGEHQDLRKRDVPVSVGLVLGKRAAFSGLEKRRIVFWGFWRFRV